MTTALVGLGSGAAHALTGPDHLVSLAPLSVGRRRGGWAVGLLWGAGHGLGTLLAGGLLLAVLSQVHLALAASWAERIAGLALAGMGVHGLLAHRRGALPGAAGARLAWRPLVAIGLLHGATGAAGLLLLLPAAATGATAAQALFLAGFTAGSTLAMAALTGALGAASRRPGARRLVRWGPPLASAGALVLGLAWALGA